MGKKYLYSVILLFLLSIGVYGQTRGIDVSKYQGTINWSKVAKTNKVKYVYVKATEGTSIQDPMYKKNIDGARAAGLPVGSYHLYSSRTTAYQQFGNFKNVVKKADQDLIPVLDIEERQCKNLYLERIDKLLELMEREYGVKPIIYTSEKVYFTHFTGKKYSSYQFFIANYRRFPKCRFLIWQYTEKGKVNGINGYVDFSEMNQKKTLDNLKIPKKKK